MLYDFNELWFSFIPITSCNVSYGSPVMYSSLSLGLNSPNNVTVKACVPDINCPLTNASSLLNMSLYTNSIVSLPISLYPYPVD